nr:hypothetical protein Iba_chr14aCG18120 [Ipomoea batatas]
MKDLGPHHFSDHFFPEILVYVEVDWDLSWVEHEHLLQQVDCHGMGGGVDPGKGRFGRVRKGFDVLLCLGVVDEFKILLALAAKDVDDQFKLVKTFGSREYRFPSQQLSKYAAY